MRDHGAMVKKLKAVILLLGLITQSVSSTYAQAGQEEDLLADTKKDLLIVTAMGGVGAVLGLSTLSFVEEPSEHLKNIVVGGAIGVIVGVGLVAWMQATKSKTNFESAFYQGPEFSTSKRHKWHRDHHQNLNPVITSATATQFQFSF